MSLSSNYDDSPKLGKFGEKEFKAEISLRRVNSRGTLLTMDI